MVKSVTGNNGALSKYLRVWLSVVFLYSEMPSGGFLFVSGCSAMK